MLCLLISGHWSHMQAEDKAAAAEERAASLEGQLQHELALKAQVSGEDAGFQMIANPICKHRLPHPAAKQAARASYVGLVLLCPLIFCHWSHTAG
jgi:hypothetical protein